MAEEEKNNITDVCVRVYHEWTASELCAGTNDSTVLH